MTTTPSSPAEWTVLVGQQSTTAVFERAENKPDAPVFVCAHGAGGNFADKSIVALTRAVRSRGLSTVRFNFLYREKKSGRPDPMPRLEECFSAVVAHTRAELDPKTLIIGGRSMGGRAASMMAASGFNCDGLLLLAYPLHPPGQPEKLRVDHLKSIGIPVLCFSGTRDPFCTRELMERALKTVKTRWDMQWIEGADHSFHVLKSSGKTDAQVLDEVAEHTQEWLAAVIS
jgi:predicted alpha/beta-hydrolase family hydrolase